MNGDSPANSGTIVARSCTGWRSRNWLGPETFLSFDKRAVSLITKRDSRSGNLRLARLSLLNWQEAKPRFLGTGLSVFGQTSFRDHFTNFSGNPVAVARVQETWRRLIVARPESRLYPRGVPLVHRTIRYRLCEPRIPDEFEE